MTHKDACLKYYYKNHEEQLNKRRKYIEERREQICKVNREYYQNHKEHYKEYFKSRRYKDKLLSYLRKYNLTESDYVNLLEIRGNTCWICGVDGSLIRRGLFVDHDHITNKVRGLLCYKCNTALGMFQDDIVILKKSIDYLKEFKDG